MVRTIKRVCTTKSNGSTQYTKIMVVVCTLSASIQMSRSQDSSDSTTTANRSSFVWQPLPLRATFRPLNRAQPEAITARAARPPPEPLALTINERSISGDSPSDNSFLPTSNNNNNNSPFSSSFFQPETPTTTTTTSSITTSTPPPPSTTIRSDNNADEDDDELPTRQPMNRFRPTRAPSNDGIASLNGGDLTGSNGAAANATAFFSNSPPRMSSECFECICEASTNCNVQSRCQTSDVRHTRCGLFLISYDQWLSTGLSRQLVSREALARDAAADERAFYDCVTQRDCAERLLTIYAQRHQKDCDKDGRIDCYDMAAIHHSGMDQCASESLLDSQYWNDFNACLGFGR